MGVLTWLRYKNLSRSKSGSSPEVENCCCCCWILLFLNNNYCWFKPTGAGHFWLAKTNTICVREHLASTNGGLPDPARLLLPRAAINFCCYLQGLRILFLWLLAVFRHLDFQCFSINDAKPLIFIGENVHGLGFLIRCLALGCACWGSYFWRQLHDFDTKKFDYGKNQSKVIFYVKFHWVS